MKQNRLYTILALGAPVLLAAGLPSDRLAFSPADDTAVSKSLRFELQFEVEDLYVSVGGLEMPPEMFGAGDDMSFSGEMTIDVTETYLASAEGRPTLLQRTFDALSLEMEGGGQSTEVEEFAELEGETVQFKWNAEDDEYEITFPESDLDEELLEALSDDMDLRVLLPTGEVDVDDTWEVQAEDLYPLFLPGGMVGSSDPGDDADIAELIEEQLLEQLEGLAEDFSVTCRYKGSSEIDDRRVAEIAFEYGGEGSLELGEIMLMALESQEELPATPDIVADLSMEISGSGTLYWDMEAGHLYSFEMSGDLELSFDMEVSMSIEGQDFDLTVNAELSGSANWELETD